ncbi:hypothetical protein RM704_31715 [Streptomyces sp. DSM 3412]|uniref:Uncharacterized protein n=1 Tax=Streptomyces gottesmaniae TaxID=3075518 RepID=A0ABU2Z754_9ACTN|nr:hypothetical protein [Streptomyces sp. DSM 3412]MDT0571968.1 hypothetical protein [Streptomyces sp. DSM 3412]
MRAVLDKADRLRGRAAGLAPGSAEERKLIEEIPQGMRQFHGMVDQAGGNATLLQMLDMAVDARYRLVSRTERLRRGRPVPRTR